MIIQIILSFLLRLFFYRAPQIDYTAAEIQEYKRIFDEAVHSNKPEINYTSSFPKCRFITYICETKGVFLHGSTNQQIDLFEPRKQTLYNGKMTEAVFASKDGIWPVFYAILDKQKVVNTFRNGCIKVASSNSKYHFYSINKSTHKKNPWTTGTVYFLPDETFIKVSSGNVAFEEWVSSKPVKPVCRIEVNPEDFLYIDKISIHHDRESTIKTWFLYKVRTKLNIRCRFGSPY